MTDRSRGVSDVLGFVFVFSLVVSMVGIVTVAGMSGLQDVRDAEQADNAQRAMEVLVDNLADVHSRGAPSRGTEIDLSGSQLAVGDPITINVTGEDATTTASFTVERESVPLVYDVTDRTTFVYEAGLLVRLRENSDAGTVLTEPPLIVGTHRTVLPILSYSGTSGRSVGGSTVLVRALHEDTALQEVDTTGQWDDLRLNVTSPRYRRWHDALESYPGVTQCETIDAQEKTHCTLDAPPERLYVTTVDVEFLIEQ